MKKRFQRWVFRCTGVPSDKQQFDKWTTTNLEISDISSVTCVLLSEGIDYDMPKLVQFDETGKLLTKCRLIRRTKNRFWRPSRHGYLNRHRGRLGKCLKSIRTEGKRRYWRLANRFEARSMSFGLSIPAAYGICSPRRHLGERSRKDLQLRW